jgi:hypothetical protein
MLHRVVWYKLTDVSEVLTASIIRATVLMMEAVSSSETSVNFYQTALCNIPKNSHIHTRRRENLKCFEFICMHKIILIIYLNNTESPEHLSAG